MKTIEYKTIDKSSWPRGEWDNEPDKKQFQDPATGLPCLIVRVPHSGHLCGYVGISESHPFYGLNCSSRVDKKLLAVNASIDDVSILGAFSEAMRTEDDGTTSLDCCLEVHGGITFGGKCQSDRPECEGICHKPDAGEPDHVWWLGFDCAHAGDLLPAIYREKLYGRYRNLSYVESECARLAMQLQSIASTEPTK